MKPSPPITAAPTTSIPLREKRSVIRSRRNEMSLKIRLARGGSKKRPYYQIVVADARSPRDGRFLEKVGSWNPMLGKEDAKRVELDADRIKDWLAKGAQPTD